MKHKPPKLRKPDSKQTAAKMLPTLPVTVEKVLLAEAFEAIKEQDPLFYTALVYDKDRLKRPKKEQQAMCDAMRRFAILSWSYYNVVISQREQQELISRIDRPARKIDKSVKKKVRGNFRITRKTRQAARKKFFPK